MYTPLLTSLLRPISAIKKLTFVLFTAATITACGGGGGSSSTNDEPGTDSTNVILANSNVMITANAGNGGEQFVIDGDDMDTNSFWQANAVVDSLTINFSQVYAIESHRY
jgi:hypothetical protein